MAIIPIWRITRSSWAKRLHSWLDEHGVKIARYVEYRRVGKAENGVHSTSPFRIEHRTPEASSIKRPGDDDHLDSTDFVIEASIDDTVTGRLFVSEQELVSVPGFGDSWEPSGTYLWGLYVDPRFRNRGIGTALVERAIDTSEHDEAVALIAPDNLPSKTLFENLGFRPLEIHTHVGCGPVSFHHKKTVDNAPLHH